MFTCVRTPQERGLAAPRVSARAPGPAPAASLQPIDPRRARAQAAAARPDPWPNPDGNLAAASAAAADAPPPHRRAGARVPDPESRCAAGRGAGPVPGAPPDPRQAQPGALLALATQADALPGDPRRGPGASPGPAMPVLPVDPRQVLGTAPGRAAPSLPADPRQVSGPAPGPAPPRLPAGPRQVVSAAPGPAPPQLPADPRQAPSAAQGPLPVAPRQAESAARIPAAAPATAPGQPGGDAAPQGPDTASAAALQPSAPGARGLQAPADPSGRQEGVQGPGRREADTARRRQAPPDPARALAGHFGMTALANRAAPGDPPHGLRQSSFRRRWRAGGPAPRREADAPRARSPRPEADARGQGQRPCKRRAEDAPAPRSPRTDQRPRDQGPRQSPEGPEREVPRRGPGSPAKRPRVGERAGPERRAPELADAAAPGARAAGMRRAGDSGSVGGGGAGQQPAALPPPVVLPPPVQLRPLVVLPAPVRLPPPPAAQTLNPALARTPSPAEVSRPIVLPAPQRAPSPAEEPPPPPPPLTPAMLGAGTEPVPAMQALPLHQEQAALGGGPAIGLMQGPAPGEGMGPAQGAPPAQQLPPQLRQAEPVQGPAGVGPGPELLAPKLAPLPAARAAPSPSRARRDGDGEPRGAISQRAQRRARADQRLRQAKELHAGLKRPPQDASPVIINEGRPDAGRNLAHGPGGRGFDGTAQRPGAGEVAIAQRPPPIVLARPGAPAGARIDGNGMARRQQGGPDGATPAALSNAEHLEALRRIRERKRPAPVTLPPPARRSAVPAGPGGPPPGQVFEPLASDAPPSGPSFRAPGVPPPGLGYAAPLGGPPMDTGPHRQMVRPRLGDGSMQAAQQMHASEPPWLGSDQQAPPMQGQQMERPPMHGQPIPGQPMQGQAVQGQPMQGQSMQGQPVQQPDNSGRPELQWHGNLTLFPGHAMPMGPAEALRRPIGDRGQHHEGPGPGQRPRQHSSQEAWPPGGPDAQGFPGQSFAPQAVTGQGPPPQGFGGQQGFAHQAAPAPAQPRPLQPPQPRPLPPQVMEAVALAVGGGLDRRVAQDIVQGFQRERPRGAGEDDGGALLRAMRDALAHAQAAQGLSSGAPAGQAPWGGPGFAPPPGLGSDAAQCGPALAQGEPPGAQQLWAGQHPSPQPGPGFAPNLAPSDAQHFAPAWAPMSQPSSCRPQQHSPEYNGAAQSRTGQQAADAREWERRREEAQRLAGPDPAWLPPKKHALRGGGGGGRSGCSAGQSGRGPSEHIRQGVGGHHAEGRHGAASAVMDSTRRHHAASGEDRFAPSLRRGDAVQGGALEPTTLARVSTSAARPAEGKGVILARLSGQAGAAPLPPPAATAPEAEEEEEGEISI